MHAGQGSEGPAAGGDPKQKTDCTFANRFFQTTVSTANKPELLSAGVLAFCAGEEGVAGFLCLCPEGSTHLDTVSPGVLACVRCRPWGDGLRHRLGVWRDNDAGPPTSCLHAGPGPRFPVQRPVTPPAALRGGCLFLWMGFKPQPCYLGVSFMF